MEADGKSPQTKLKETDKTDDDKRVEADGKSPQTKVKETDITDDSEPEPEPSKESEQNKSMNECDKPMREISDHSYSLVQKDWSQFKCLTCDQTFTDVQSLRKHTKTHEKIKCQSQCCSYCGLKFTTKYALNTHRRKHIAENPYKCQQCDETFTQRSKLTAPHSKWHKCDYCGKSFATASSLRIHEIKHTGDKPFKCQQCNKGFLRKKSLVRHGKTHA